MLDNKIKVGLSVISTGIVFALGACSANLPEVSYVPGVEVIECAKKERYVCASSQVADSDLPLSAEFDAYERARKRVGMAKGTVMFSNGKVIPEISFRPKQFQREEGKKTYIVACAPSKRAQKASFDPFKSKAYCGKL